METAHIIILVVYGVACVVCGGLAWAIVHGGTNKQYPTYVRPEERHDQ